MDNTFDNIPLFVRNMFEDIGAGICLCQKLADANKGKYDMSKVKKYKPKTEIPNIIKNILEETDYRKSYEWQYEKKFIYEGDVIEVIKYSIDTGDYCIININGEEMKVRKKYLKELYLMEQKGRVE